MSPIDLRSYTFDMVRLRSGFPTLKLSREGWLIIWSDSESNNPKANSITKEQENLL
jgi:hypothetical protein